MKKLASVIVSVVMMMGLPMWAQGNGGKGGPGKGINNFDGGIEALLLDLPMEDISPDERRGLRFMREEEKLARDVYMAFYREWNLPIFRNIARSEQRHMDSVKVLLDKYGIADPAANDIEGIFVNPELQQLFLELVAGGKVSLIEALRIGASIEELDIKDLQRHLKNADNQDIRLAYQNLLKGSRNHLRAFVSKYESRNGEYQAQILSPEEVSAILSAPMERGVVDEEGESVFGPYGW